MINDVNEVKRIVTERDQAFKSTMLNSYKNIESITWKMRQYNVNNMDFKLIQQRVNAIE